MLNSVWELKVRFGETDPAGIVFYPNFYKWMDQATHEMFGTTDFSTKKNLAGRKGIPLVEAHCQFRKPLRYDDRVKVVSAVREVKNKVFKIEHKFYRDEDLMAEGYEIRAWVDFSGETIKSESIPDSFRQLLLSGGEM